jgi:TusA-related sulfurtransferase
MPVIALARTMADQSPGATVVLLSDDPAARYDVPAWCRMTGHEFVAESAVEGADPPYWRFTVRHS